MLEGVQNVLGRIQQIESSVQSRQEGIDGGFGQHLQQAQAALSGANFTAAPSGLPGPQVPGNQAFLSNVNPSLWSMMNQQGSTFSILGSQLERAAASMDGRQYWSNACAHAVNDALKQVGIDIKDKVNNNPEWVPNYADLGTKVNTVSDMKPGDLVIYNNYLGQGGYDHIGIYAGDGQAWNVSTAAGHKWVKTPIGSRFQEGRRITVAL